MKRWLLLILFSFTGKLFYGSPEISVLTCSPGNEIYSVFGHSAIRVTDNEKGIDDIYNFGMFDFDTPHFVLKFVKKELYYFLDIQRPQSFIAEYTASNRKVVEQRLHLTETQKTYIMGRLEFLYRPENRYYLYAFLEENCSTAIRDLLLEAGVPLTIRPIEKTNRELIEDHLTHKPWLRLGINMVLGKTLDKPNDNFKSMFLPEYLYRELNGITNAAQPLVGSIISLNDIDLSGQEKSTPFIKPFTLFIIILLVVLLWNSKPVAITLYTCIAVVGLVLTAMMLFSAHAEVKWNFNILWCNPLYLIYIPFLIRNKAEILFPVFFILTIVATLIIWIFNIQQFDWALLPLWISLILLHIKPLAGYYREYCGSKE